MSRLDDIKARATAATEGPWEVDHCYSPGSAAEHTWQVESEHGYDDGTGSPLSDIDCLRESDAEFVAHARTDVPALVAAVEAVSLHVPFADTAGNVYCSVRGADYYTDCPTFELGDAWPDHIANVVAGALGEGERCATG